MDQSFTEYGFRGYWWTSDLYIDEYYNITDPIIRIIYFEESSINRNILSTSNGFSVRCVKD